MNKKKFNYLPLMTVLIFLIFVPFIFLISSFQLEGGAETVPIGASLVAIICGIMGFLQRKKMHFKIKEENFPIRRIFIFLLIIVLFLIGTSVLGFYSSAWFSIIAIYLFVSSQVNKKRIVVAIITATLFTFVAWELFYNILNIMTPTGIYI